MNEPIESIAQKISAIGTSANAISVFLRMSSSHIYFSPDFELGTLQLKGADKYSS